MSMMKRELSKFRVSRVAIDVLQVSSSEIQIQMELMKSLRRNRRVVFIKWTFMVLLTPTQEMSSPLMVAEDVRFQLKLLRSRCFFSSSYCLWVSKSHSRESGNLESKHEIPAFAGMTMVAAPEEKIQHAD